MDKSIVFPGEISRQTLNARVKRKQLRLVAPRIYTTDLQASLETIVNQHWHVVVGHLFPGAVITDRSAVTGSKVGTSPTTSKAQSLRCLKQRPCCMKTSCP